MTSARVEAERIFHWLPTWVTENLAIGVEEIEADIEQARRDMTTDSMRDDLHDRGAKCQADGEVNAASFYVDELDKIVASALDECVTKAQDSIMLTDDTEEKTPVVRMRCPKCETILCPEMFE